MSDTRKAKVFCVCCPKCSSTLLETIEEARGSTSRFKCSNCELLFYMYTGLMKPLVPDVMGQGQVSKEDRIRQFLDLPTPEPLM